jgi:Tfp pilus assembly protein PilZ
MKNRRQYQRIASHLGVKYTIMTKGIVEAPASSENISQSGIMVTLQDFFATGTRLLLEISLPDHSNPVMASGDVVWQKRIDGEPCSYATGIEYVKVAEDDASRLSRYVVEALEEAPGDNRDKDNGFLGFLKSLLNRFGKIKPPSKSHP